MKSLFLNAGNEREANIMKAVIKIALLQLIASKNDQEANLKNGDLYCRKSKECGADIVLFPEMWNIGYTSTTNTKHKFFPAIL